jgi:lipoprotein-releasing system permease protein
MYKFHLILKYLRKRRIAWVSLIAVMLCTTMVLVVISVMGGWIRMFRESFHSIGGDVVVQSTRLEGFPHYEEMIRQITALPEVKAAAPVLKSFALINVNNQIRKGVEVVGYPPNISDINGFVESLNLRKESGTVDFSLRKDITYRPPPGYQSPRPVTEWDGMIVGLGVLGIGKDEEGNVHRPELMYRVPVTLTVLPISPESSQIDMTEKASRFFWIVDDSRTKVYLYDSNTVYVPFDVLQRDLRMEATDESPAARTSEIQVALKPDANLAQAKAKVANIVDTIARQHGFFDDFLPIYSVKTWEETHKTFLGAVEKEKLLVTMLFAIISVVAIFLIFCIFYMIVVEKTRDIGIIKSVGATSSGVAGIFLGYGMAIGIVGGGLGLLLGWLIVRYINELHDGLAKLTGQYMWSPETYLFDTIPNSMNPTEVTIIVAVAIISSIIGALVPAVRAARMHPVEALRWE